MNKTPKIIVVAGPTASGKSDFAVDLAIKNNGEIISADSKQIYIGLDIGTGKITKEEMKGVRHHMISVYDLEENISVVRYESDAKKVLEDIISRGKTPIICGGTGQYIDSLVYNQKFPKVPPNKILREKLEKESKEILLEKLKKLDSKRAENVDIHNKVRLIRAIEIAEEIGYVPELTEQSLIYNTEFFLMSPTKELLNERIKKRLENRLIDGDESKMLDEARALRARAIPDSRISSLGLEYKWMNKYLKSECDFEEMKSGILIDSIHYAKRQITWNKKYEKFAKKVEVK